MVPVERNDVGIIDKLKAAFSLGGTDAVSLTSDNLIPRIDITSAVRPRSYEHMLSMGYLACEQTKARALASLPVYVVREDGIVRENMRDHPIARLLRGRANPLMSGKDVLRWLSIYRDTFGTAYLRVEWSKGVPVALWPVCVKVKPKLTGRPYPFDVAFIVADGDKYTKSGVYLDREIIAVKSPISTDGGVTGASVAAYAASEIGLSIDLERFYESMLHNGNHMLGHVEVPNLHDQNEVESIKRAVRAKSGVENAGEAPIFGYGAKWVNDQQTMQDAALIEQQTWVLQQICRATCVPPMKVYDTSKSTYAHDENARIEFATDTMMPECADIETCFQKILDYMGDEDCRLKFDLNGLMRGDSATRSAFYKDMVYMGAMSRNEVRSKEDMDPRDGLDATLVPCNYAIVEDDGSLTIVSGSASQPSDGSQTSSNMSKK